MQPIPLDNSAIQHKHSLTGQPLHFLLALVKGLAYETSVNSSHDTYTFTVEGEIQSFPCTMLLAKAQPLDALHHP